MNHQMSQAEKPGEVRGGGSQLATSPGHTYETKTTSNTARADSGQTRHSPGLPG